MSGLPKEAAGVEEGAEGVTVLVAGEPRLSTVGLVQFGIVPGKRPHGWCAATLRRADERLHARSLAGSRVSMASPAATGEAAGDASHVNHAAAASATPSPWPFGRFPSTSGRPRAEGTVRIAAIRAGATVEGSGHSPNPLTLTVR